jgi:NADH dehydrogenase FAD-containing subunit
MTNGRFEFKQGRLTEVLQDKNKINIVLSDGEMTCLEYDVLCICTGANYVGPWRAADNTLDTLEGRNNELNVVKESISNSKSILCIGAGDTGLETAGWLKESYPHKVIGVSMRGDTILKAVKGAHKLAESNLKEMDI